MRRAPQLHPKTLQTRKPLNPRIDKMDYDRIKFSGTDKALKMSGRALVRAVESVIRHPEEEETVEHRYHRIQVRGVGEG